MEQKKKRHLRSASALKYYYLKERERERESPVSNQNLMYENHVVNFATLMYITEWCILVITVA